MPPLLLAAPFALLQLRYNPGRQSRTLVAELCGAVALGVLAALIALAGGRPLGPALLLWLLLVLWAAPAILYVRTRLRLARDDLARRASALLAHLGALALVGTLAWSGLAGWTTVVAFAVLMARALIGLLLRSLRTPTPIVGVQDLAFSLVFVVGIALA